MHLPCSMGFPFGSLTNPGNHHLFPLEQAPSLASNPLTDLTQRTTEQHGCQMAIAIFLDHLGLVFQASGLWLHYATLQNRAPTPCTLAQSKERKGSNFAIWQPCRASNPPSIFQRTDMDRHDLPSLSRNTLIKQSTEKGGSGDHEEGRAQD